MIQNQTTFDMWDYENQLKQYKLSVHLKFIEIIHQIDVLEKNCNMIENLFLWHLKYIVDTIHRSS